MCDLNKNKIERGMVNKSEALAIMPEVLGVLRESVLISYVSLDFECSKISKSPEDYLIKLKCDLDDFLSYCFGV
jgi:hypothetical protein